MARQRPQATGGGKTKGHKKKNDYSIYGDIFAHRNRGGGSGGNIAAIRNSLSPVETGTQNPTPGGGFSMFDNSGQAIIEQIQQGLKSSKFRDRLKENLPPIKPVSNVMTPGSGVGNANLSGLLKGLGGKNKGGRKGGKGGRAPAVDTGLDVNDKGIFKRAQNAASIEYNPQIEAIRNMIQSTQSQGQEGIKDTGNAYAALQKATQQTVAPIGQQFDTQQNAISQIYAGLQGSINNRYDQTAARTTGELERLGIGDVAGEALQGQTSDRDFLGQLAGLQGRGVNDALEIQQQAAQNLARNSAVRAGMEGANRTSDMRNELADKILELREQGASLKGNKGRAIRELAEQYRQEAVAQAERQRAFELDAAQFQESVRQANREFRYGREMDRAGLALEAAGMQAEANKAPEVNLKDLDPYERAAYKADQLVPGAGDRTIAYLQNLIRADKNIRQGFYVKRDKNDPTKTIKVPITPEQFGYLAAKNAKIAGLPKNSIQKIAAAFWGERDT